MSMFLASVTTTFLSLSTCNTFIYLFNFFVGDESDITISQLLDFWTGADRVPPCGFDKQLVIDFYTPEIGVYRLPSASTCALTLYLPRGIEEPEVLSGMMRRALTECQGFGFI